MEFLTRFLKRRYILFVVIVTVLSAILGSAYSVIVKNRQTRMVIEFNYPGSEKGLKPDGSVFDISELKSPAVIEQAKKKLEDKSVDTEFLRSRIVIASKVTEQSINRIISAVQNEKNIVYMPTAFYVYYSQKNKFSKNESRIFIDSLAEAYTEYFSEKYSEKNDILKFLGSETNFDGKDYLEIYKIIKNKVDSMISYIKAHQNENRAFYSDDRANLGMAAKKLESFRDTSVEKLYAFIVQNGISKDSDEYVRSLDYFIDENEVEYRKKIEGSDIIKDAAEEYNQYVAIAFVPSVDSRHNYYMSRTQTSVDYLTKQSYADGVEASKTLKEIDYYKNLRTKFSNQIGNTEANRQEADAMIRSMSADLEQISKEVLKIDNEYLKHKTQNYFTVRLPGKYNISITFIIKITLLGFIISVMLVIMNELLKKKILKRFEVIEKAFSAVELAKKERGE